MKSSRKKRLKTARLHIRAIQELRTLDKDMPITMALVLLELADGDEREVRQLVKKLGISQSSLHRALTTLGKRHWRRDSHKSGLRLVKQRIPERDRRLRLAQLTKRGDKFLKDLLSG